MEGIKIEVIGNIARVIEKPSKITAGTVGLPTEFAFDSQWDGLKKMAVFRTGHFSIPVEITEPNTIVPWEVLEHPKGRLSIGVHGVNEDGSIAIPTIWANVGVIHAGAIPEGGSPADPTPPAWKRIEDEMRSLRGLVDDMSLMIVTVDREKKNANHNASQIYEHIQGGGTACLIDNYIHYPLIRSMSGQAEFGLYDQDEDCAICYIVFQNGEVDIATTDIVDDEILQGKAVFYHEPQSLTYKQKAQARENIGAMPAVEVEKEYTDYPVFVQGSISKGVESSSGIRVRSKEYIDIANFVEVPVNSSKHRVYGHCYDESKTWIGDLGAWLASFTKEDILAKCPEACFFRIVVSTANTKDSISPEDVNGVVGVTYKKMGVTADFVLYAPQELTPEQQEQARANIGAISTSMPYIYGGDPNETDPLKLVSLQSLETGWYMLDGMFSAYKKATGNYFCVPITKPTRVCIYKDAVSNESTILFLIESGTVRFATLTATSFDYKNTSYQLASKATTIDNTADDDHYPTAKAVFDAINVAMTDEKYFDIDYDGIVSLKAEYQADGSKNAELPEIIVIPDVIGGTAVSGFAVSMFENNLRVKEITIPDGVSELPDYFCKKANNLKALHNTEHIVKLGKQVVVNTQIVKAMFPNLQEAGDGALAQAVFMHTADIGNITNIPYGMFRLCHSLSVVRGGGNVKTIGNEAFYGTKSLKNLPLLSQVTYIDTNAFYKSRVQFDWASIADQCTFAKRATPVIDNTTDYWTGAEYTPCENALGTIFSQSASEWKDIEFGDSGKTYYEGCAIFAVLHIHSALSGNMYTHPDEFTAELRAIDPSLVTYDRHPTTYSQAKPMFDDLGYKATEYTDIITKESYEAICSALARGAYIWAVVSTPDYVNTGHAVVIYGINSIGEVLVVDSSNGGFDAFEGTESNHWSLKYRMPLQNLTGPDSNLIVVEKV